MIKVNRGISRILQFKDIIDGQVGIEPKDMIDLVNDILTEFNPDINDKILITVTPQFNDR